MGWWFGSFFFGGGRAGVYGWFFLFIYSGGLGGFGIGIGVAIERYIYMGIVIYNSR